MEKGFTILELLLYVGILSIVIFSIAFFSQTMLSARVKNQTIAEVEQQGQYAMQQITQIIRNASAITMPVVGADGTSLIVATYTGGTNPTVIDSANSALQIKEGVAVAVPITSARVAVSNLSFQNVSRASTPGTVRVQFTITYVNPTGKNEFNYAKTFYASASIRK